MNSDYGPVSFRLGAAKLFEPAPFKNPDRSFSPARDRLLGFSSLFCRRFFKICEISGLGEEGIASLERAFLLAGARSVVASLWTADDTYTIGLMKRFYQHLVNGSDEGAALRQAKLDLLKEFGDQALPIYWAGFTLVGDGATVIFKQ